MISPRCSIVESASPSRNAVASVLLDCYFYCVANFASRPSVSLYAWHVEKSRRYPQILSQHESGSLTLVQIALKTVELYKRQVMDFGEQESRGIAGCSTFLASVNLPAISSLSLLSQRINPASGTCSTVNSYLPNSSTHGSIFMHRCSCQSLVTLSTGRLAAYRLSCLPYHSRCNSQDLVSCRIARIVQESQQDEQTPAMHFSARTNLMACAHLSRIQLCRHVRGHLPPRST